MFSLGIENWACYPFCPCMYVLHLERYLVMIGHFLHALQVTGQILFPIPLLSQISSRSSSYLLSPNSSQVMSFPSKSLTFLSRSSLHTYSLGMEDGMEDGEFVKLGITLDNELGINEGDFEKHESQVI